MTEIRHITLLCVLILSSGTLSAQTSEKELLAAAREYMDYGEFDNAELYYKKLLDKAPDNPLYNFELGVFYFQTAAKKTRAIPYFEKADAKKAGEDEFPEMYYFLAQCYQLSLQFDKAIDYYNLFGHHLKKNKRGLALQQDVNHHIEGCNYGKVFRKTPVDAVITNAGPSINTADPEYGAVAQADGKQLFFTARRPGNYGEKVFDETLLRMLNNEDIYSAALTAEGSAVTIDKGKKVSSKINTEGHDAAIGVSADGLKLFIYRDNDLWVSQVQGKGWGEPNKLNSKFNTKKGQETSIAVSANQDVVLVVSSRKGGYGGKDIYISELQPDGNWGPLVNLGPNVNTSYDEESPWVSADGKTLYFSSQGHSSMGGYDIFHSTRKNGEWTAPRNMGFPLNTTANDLFFTIDENTGHGYFSSDREEGLGYMDIYHVMMKDRVIPVTEIRGVVLAGKALQPVGAKITVRNTNDNKIVGFYTSNEDTASTDVGKYLLVIDPGEEYNLLIEAEGFAPYSQDIFVPARFEYHQMYQEIHLGEETSTSYHALFDIDKEYKSAYSYIEQQLSVDKEYAEYLEKDNMYSAYINTLIRIDKLLSNPDKVVNEAGRESKEDGGTAIGEFFTPDEILAVLMDSLSSKEFVIPDILFDYDQATLQESSKLELNKLYTFLKNSPKVAIEIRGHTDSRGNEDHNIRLSQRRAEAVRKYLADKGISAERIRARGFGSSKPVAPNMNPDGSDNPRGRARNRRIEVKMSYM